MSSPSAEPSQIGTTNGKVVVKGFAAKFGVLRGAIRELWLTFGIKLLAVAAYGLTNSTIKLWLSSDFGYSDKQALGLVALWSGVMTLITLLVGPLTDALGLRRTLLFGAIICAGARAVMGLSTHAGVALVLGLAPLAVGEALAAPALIAAVRHYSTTPQRSISFSLVYTMMNAGFLVASYAFDFIRHTLGEHGHVLVPGVHFQISTYRMLFLASLGIELCLIPLILLLRAGARVDGESVVLGQPRESRTQEKALLSFGEMIRKAAVDSYAIFKSLVRQDGFYRLLLFLVFIAFLKLIFMQMYYVYPTFGIRELGDGAPIGRLWAVNSITVIILVPIVGALTQRFRAYTMVIVGGAICAVSVFIMATPPQWFSAMATGWMGDWLGHHYLGLKGAVHPYYVMVFLFVVLLSIGESFYSPRVYEYAASIAPKGQEASYSALSYVPFLLAKVMVGTVSGFLLAKYCPPQPPRHSEMLWLVIACFTAIAPVGLLCLQRFVRVKENDRS